MPGVMEAPPASGCLPPNIGVLRRTGCLRELGLCQGFRGAGFVLGSQTASALNPWGTREPHVSQAWCEAPARLRLPPSRDVWSRHGSVSRSELRREACEKTRRSLRADAGLSRSSPVSAVSRQGRLLPPTSNSVLILLNLEGRA